MIRFALLLRPQNKVANAIEKASPGLKSRKKATNMPKMMRARDRRFRTMEVVRSSIQELSGW